MKKTSILFVLLLGLFICLPAQNPDELQISSQDETFSLNIAGFKINFDGNNGKSTDSCRSKKEPVTLSIHENGIVKSRISFDLIGPICHGWNNLVQSEYVGDWQGHGDFLESQRAFSFGMSFCTLSVSLNRQRSLRMNFGARWDWTRFYYNQPVVFHVDNNNHLFPVFPAEQRKLRMFSSYMGFPLGISYHYHGVRVAANISAEWLVGSHWRYKGDKDKLKAEGFNKFRSAVELIIGYRSLGAFVSYGITPMLIKGAGNQAHTLTAGFVICLDSDLSF